MCAQPKTVTAEEAARLLHISKRKCSWMLQNGHIPCIDTGKKTRRYTILRKDVLRCARSIDSIEFPQMFSSVKESRKKPNLTAEQCEAYMSHLLAKWRTKPSVLTVRAISELLGYRKKTVARWIAKGHLKSASTHGEPIIAKAWLADFCCHYGYHIVKKSEKHKKLEESFFKPPKE